MDTITSLASGSSPTPSSTDKVLRNQDVLSLIFANLVEYKVGSNPKSNTCAQLTRVGLADLLRVGLACKAFLEPILNLLWYEVDSLLPLLHLISKVTKRGGVYTSSSVIHTTDLQTFESYSRRIRHLHLSSFQEEVSSHIYGSITRYLFNRNSSLFSALRCLDIPSFSRISQENLLFLPLITSSSLSKINIGGVKGDIEIHLASFLYGIAHLHPAIPMIHPLSKLHLSGRITGSTLAQLDGFKKLSTLSLHFVREIFPIATLSSLSKLSSLSTLYLTVENHGTSDIKLQATPKVYIFPDLRTLHVTGTAVTVLGILRSIYGEGLVRLVTGFNSFGPNTTTATGTSNACLKRCLEMAPHLLFYSIIVNPAISPSPNMFAPLPNNYGQLRSLHLVSRIISVEDFCDLFDHARPGSWTALEELKIQLSRNVSGRSETNQAVPLSSLSIVAASCPRLRTLELYLYHPLGEVGGENQVLENRIRNSQLSGHKLTDLTIVFLGPFVAVPWSGDIMDAVVVSRFIDHVFPSVQNVNIFDKVSDVRKLWYSGITAMMKNYRDVRETYAVKGEHTILG